MLKQIAAVSIISILVGQTLPASAEYGQSKPASSTEKPSTEAMPSATPAEKPYSEMQPMTPSPAPSTEAQPSTTPVPEVMPTEPSRMPSTEMTPSTPTVPSPETMPTTPSTEMTPTTPSTVPSLPEVQPTTPVTPSTSTPSVTPTAEAKPTTSSAKTMVLERETITGIKEISFPTPPVTPAFFTLPMQLRVVKDTSITSNTPITDKSAKDISTWAAAIRACAADKPAFVRVVDDQEVPFMINGSEGKVRMNANDRPVCSS